MSIFRESFPDFVRTELENRQERASVPSRRVGLVNYQSTRNAFVRMTSAVEVEGRENLSKQYILQGGALYKDGDKTLFRKGIGNSFTNAYSSVGSTGTNYARGIRPMPGITSINVDTKTAYGSLLEARVNFVCWDIQQLEDLEVLFMRPGYTVLLEWGWSALRTTPEFFDLFGVQPGTSFSDINKQLFDKCNKNKGNYEAILGYVKNYQWVARPDGGYDCTTYIISLGETLESLKLNYAPLNINLESSSSEIVGLLKTYRLSETGENKKIGIAVGSNTKDTIKDYYSRGILSGLLFEVQKFISLHNNDNDGYSLTQLYLPEPGKATYSRYNVISRKWNFKDSSDLPKSAIGDTYNYYITLGSLCKLVNQYVLPKVEGNETGSLVAISTLGRGYVSGSIENNQPLECIAHPLQISTDVTKCLIKPDVWMDGGVGALAEAIQKNNNPVQPERPIQSQEAINFIKNPSVNSFLRYLTANKVESIDSLKEKCIDLRKYIENSIGTATRNEISKASGGNQAVYNLILPNNVNGGNITDVNVLYRNGDTKSQLGLNILKWMKVNSENELYQKIFEIVEQDDSSRNLQFQSLSSLTPSFKKFIRSNNVNIISTFQELSFKGFTTPYGTFIYNQFTGITIQESSQAAQKSLQALNDLTSYFVENGKYDKGLIPNIYIDIDYLHSILNDTNLQSKDPQGKNTINILDFFKTIIKTIQDCTGNINNFDIHIDGRDSIARIIDLNITSPEDSKNNLFQIELHNLKSVARNYKIESKIFPEQGSIIAISAQVPAGQLGYNNSTLTAYNRGIKDRLKPSVITPLSTSSNQVSYKDVLISSFTQLNKYFTIIDDSKANIKYAPGAYNNVLRDLLGFLSSIEETNNFKFNGILPVTLSIDMDGIGGIVIGNLFVINDDVLPASYKNVTGYGRKLGFLVKGLNHRLENNDWVTSIDAYPFLIPSENDLTYTDITLWQRFFNIAETIDENQSLQVVSDPEPIKNIYIPTLQKALPNASFGLKTLLTAQTQKEGFKPGTISFDLNNPGNFRDSVGNIPIRGRGPGSRSGFVAFRSLEDGIKAQAFQLNLVVKNQSRAGYPKNPTLRQYIEKYAPVKDGNNPTQYTNFIVNFFKNNGKTITPDTLLSDIVKLK